MKKKINNDGSPVIKGAIAKLMRGENLTRNESRLVMNEIMDKKATDAQISAYLVALRIKGETVDEITGAAEAMTHTASMKVKQENMVDICGTGGDNLSTFNISTTAALVAAGAGVTVAKHGHRSVSSKCGSADLLQNLGIQIDMPRNKIRRCLKEIGLGFFFDPKFHKSWHYALGPRQEIGARTVFNILGPLTNPARIRRQVVGVYDPSLMQTLIQVLRELGAEQVMMVHGAEGLDEISITGETYILELIDNQIYEYTITPENFNLRSAPIQNIQSTSCEQNVEYLHSVLDGRLSPARDVVLLNAGAAIKVSGKVDSLYEGIELAQQSIDSGAAKEKLRLLVEMSAEE